MRDVRPDHKATLPCGRLATLAVWLACVTSGSAAPSSLTATAGANVPNPSDKTTVRARPLLFATLSPPSTGPSALPTSFEPRLSLALWPPEPDLWAWALGSMRTQAETPRPDPQLSSAITASQRAKPRRPQSHPDPLSRSPNPSLRDIARALEPQNLTELGPKRRHPRAHAMRHTG